MARRNQGRTLGSSGNKQPKDFIQGVAMHLLCAKTSCIAITFIVVSVLLFATPQLARCQTETVLYSFSGQSGDGANPTAGLIMDKAGNLYGTTAWGGDLSCNAGNAEPGCGTVFKLVPAGGNWTESVLYTFGTQSGDGNVPSRGSLVMSGTKLYGTTLIGGYFSCYSPRETLNKHASNVE